MDKKYSLINEKNVEICYLNYIGNEITYIYVFVGYRGNGYARQLLQNFLAEFNLNKDQLSSQEVIIQKIIQKI